MCVHAIIQGRQRRRQIVQIWKLQLAYLKDTWPKLREGCVSPNQQKKALQEGVLGCGLWWWIRAGPMQNEDEMVGWHHWLSGHEFEQAPGVADGQGGLACCSPWGPKELDMTEWLIWSDWMSLGQLKSRSYAWVGVPSEHGLWGSGWRMCWKTGGARGWHFDQWGTITGKCQGRQEWAILGCGDSNWTWCNDVSPPFPRMPFHIQPSKGHESHTPSWDELSSSLPAPPAPHTGLMDGLVGGSPY